MKKVIGWTIFVVFFVIASFLGKIVGGIIGKQSAAAIQQPQLSISEKIQRVAEIADKNTPTRLDEWTTLNSVRANGNTITYSLLYHGEVAADQIGTVGQRVKWQNAPALCEKMKPLGSTPTLVYQYVDQVGKRFSWSLPLSECPWNS